LLEASIGQIFPHNNRWVGSVVAKRNPRIFGRDNDSISILFSLPDFA